MSAQPDIGEWYRVRGGELLEVVAIDEDDGTVEVQYFDGTVEELDLADWQAQRTKGEIEDADAPEDWSGSADVEGDEDTLAPSASLDGDPQMAGGLDGLDLFESNDLESPDGLRRKLHPRLDRLELRLITNRVKGPCHSEHLERRVALLLGPR
jgi:hypothetical protein